MLKPNLHQQNYNIDIVFFNQLYGIIVQKVGYI